MHPASPAQPPSPMRGQQAAPPRRRQLEESRDDSDVRYNNNVRAEAETPARAGVYFRATMRFFPQQAGDLQLEPGDSVLLVHQASADWYLGRNLRTGRVGVFPSTFVSLLT